MFAIEKTLSKKKGRAIYVSPTKALVHQIFVEISNRFTVSSAFASFYFLALFSNILFWSFQNPQLQLSDS
jgi:hypothetical protein